MEANLTGPNMAHFSSLWFSQGNSDCIHYGKKDAFMKKKTWIPFQVLFFSPQGQIDDKQDIDSASLTHQSATQIFDRQSIHGK